MTRLKICPECGIPMEIWYDPHINKYIHQCQFCGYTRESNNGDD